MNKQFLILLLLAIAAYGQQQRVAIINTVDDRDSIGTSDLTYLTDRLRETAVNILQPRYGVMTTESIVAFLGSQEQAAKECKAASCLAELGRKVNADYVAQARVGRFGKDLAIKTELYNSKSGNLIGSFTGNSKDIYGLLALIDEKAPALFKKMPGLSGGSAGPSIAGGISGLETGGGNYMLDGEKNYLVSLNTEPPGAILSFDGVPATSCPKTPCKVELREGNVRIVAAMDQFDRADTTVSIKYNNQNVTIRMKSNFGILDVRPVYSDGIGSNRQWNLSINGKPYSLGEVRLSPNKYSVKLSHDCYEDIGFSVGINKDKREVFDMTSVLRLKNGGLSLSAERNGEPVSEPVFVNGRRAGETPFSGTVPICAKIEIGENREAVYADLRYNEKVKHTHIYSAYASSQPYPQPYPQTYSYTPTQPAPASSPSSGIETKWGLSLGMPLYFLSFDLYSDSDNSPGIGAGFSIGPKVSFLFNDVVSFDFEGNFVWKKMIITPLDIGYDDDISSITISELAFSMPILLKITGENFYFEGGIQYDAPINTTIGWEDTMGDSDEDEFSTRSKSDIGLVLGWGRTWGNVDFGTRLVFAMGDFDDYKRVSSLFTIHLVLSILF